MESKKTVVFTTKDAGDWMNLILIALLLMRKGYEVFFAVDYGSVSVQKLSESGLKGEEFKTTDELINKIGLPKIVISGMSSHLGRKLPGKTNVMSVCCHQNEYFHLWGKGPDVIFTMFPIEDKLVKGRWGDKTKAVMTDYPYLDPLANKKERLKRDRSKIREGLKIKSGEKLVWLAGDKQGLGPLFEMVLSSISELERDDIVIFPNFHPGANEDEKKQAEEIMNRFSQLRYVKAKDFPSFEARFAASDILIGSVLSSMHIQAGVIGCQSIGTTLPGDMEKQEFVIGSDRVEDNPFVIGNHISHAGDRESLTQELEKHLSGKINLTPFPPLDGKATERVVKEILKHI